MKGNNIRQLNIVTFKSLNKGLECSVKLEKLIILIAQFFWKLNKGCKVD